MEYTNSHRYRGYCAKKKSADANFWPINPLKAPRQKALMESLQACINAYQAKLEAGQQDDIYPDKELANRVMALDGPGLWYDTVLGVVKKTDLRKNPIVMRHLGRFCPEIESMALRRRLAALLRNGASAERKAAVEAKIFEHLKACGTYLPSARWRRLYDTAKHIRGLSDDTLEAMVELRKKYDPHEKSKFPMRFSYIRTMRAPQTVVASVDLGMGA